ncbi:MAG: PaaI family thioesterase [Salinirussus sp.]
MDIARTLSTLPFNELLGIEVTEAADGRAHGEIAFDDKLHSVEGVAHGAVAYALADTVGVAAVLSEGYRVAPTIDMRIDYLAPVTGAIEATATVARLGGSVAVVDIDVTEKESERVATARGVYKTGGDGSGSAWDPES